MTHVAKNIAVQEFLLEYVFISFRQIPMGGITKLKIRYILTLLEMVFQSDCAIYTSTSNVWEFYILGPCHLVFSIFNFSHSN